MTITQTYEEFEAELEAIHDGTAIQLTHCDLCPTGSPKRGILSSWNQPQSFSDPSTVLTLSCGHKVI